MALSPAPTPTPVLTTTGLVGEALLILNFNGRGIKNTRVAVQRPVASIALSIPPLQPKTGRTVALDIYLKAAGQKVSWPRLTLRRTSALAVQPTQLLQPDTDTASYTTETLHTTTAITMGDTTFADGSKVLPSKPERP